MTRIHTSLHARLTRSSLMTRMIVAVAGLSLVIPMSQPALGHHSAAPFDFTKSAQLTGTVVQFDVINPHSHIILRVADQRGTRDIGFEGHSASNFYRQGWRRGSVSAGDKISVSFAPRRDGADGGFVMQFRTRDGKVIGFGGLSPSTGAQQ